MKYLNIITLAVVAGIGFLIYKIWRAQQIQNQMMMAVAVKTGALETEKKPKTIKAIKEGDNQEEREAPKKKLNAFDKKMVDLFSDGIPKKLGDMKKLWISKHGNIDDDKKFNNTMYNLKPAFWLNFEKIDGVNFWGLDEWFDDDGSLFEEYAEKIEGLTNSTTSE